jgi:hypothetical protein
VAELAVQLAKFSTLAGGKMGTLSPHCGQDGAVCFYLNASMDDEAIAPSFAESQGGPAT